MNNHIKNLEFLLKLEKSSAWPPEKKQVNIDSLEFAIKSINQLEKIKIAWRNGGGCMLVEAIKETGEK